MGVIIISRYSGKCDLYDSLSIHNYTDDELKNNIKIYVGNSQEALKINKRTDLIPYYPYIIGCAYYNNDEKTSIIRLTYESYVDSAERETLEYYLKDLLRINNRCKRKHVEFNTEDAVKEICFWGYNKEAISKLANRVKAVGKKASINDIHLYIYDYYRKELVETMLNNGIDPCEWGYERFAVKESPQRRH